MTVNKSLDPTIDPTLLLAERKIRGGHPHSQHQGHPFSLPRCSSAGHMSHSPIAHPCRIQFSPPDVTKKIFG